MRGAQGIVIMLRLSKSVEKKKIEFRMECLTWERVAWHIGRSYSLSERCWLFHIVRWRVLMKLSSKIGRSHDERKADTEAPSR